MTNYLDLEINHNYRKGYQDGFADGYAEAWVPVAEATPDNGQRVQIYIDTMRGGICDYAYYEGGRFMGSHWNFDQESVTHWMPEPGAPASETEGGGDAADV